MLLLFHFFLEGSSRRLQEALLTAVVFLLPLQEFFLLRHFYLIECSVYKLQDAHTKNKLFFLHLLIPVKRHFRFLMQ